MGLEQLSYEEKDRILNEFILNRDQLLDLTPYLNNINIFVVLKTKDYEIRHSNLLAWLLDPHGSHGLGDQFVRLFVERVIRRNPDFGFAPEEWAYLDYSECDVFREKHWADTDRKDSLDIMLKIEADEKNHIIAIENKVKSKESKDQTTKYREHLIAEYPCFKQMYVYLTADDEEPQDPHWATLSYVDINEMLETALKYCEIGPEAKLIITNYRKVVMDMLDITDEMLKKKVRKIYLQNKDAIDLINMYLPNTQSEVSEYIAEKLRAAGEAEYNKAVSDGLEFGNIIYEVNPDSHGIISAKSYIRFNTRKMDAFIKPLDEKNSCWNTKDNYYYEITFPSKTSDETFKCAFKIVLNLKSLNPDDPIYKAEDELIKITGYTETAKEKKNARSAIKAITSSPINLNAEKDVWQPDVDEFISRVLDKVNKLESQLPCLDKA